VSTLILYFLSIFLKVSVQRVERLGIKLKVVENEMQKLEIHLGKKNFEPKFANYWSKTDMQNGATVG
jgi:hypothetical protein